MSNPYLKRQFFGPLTNELLKITGWIDQGLNEKAYIIPGLGDFGERRSVERRYLVLIMVLTTSHYEWLGTACEPWLLTNENGGIN